MDSRGAAISWTCSHDDELSIEDRIPPSRSQDLAYGGVAFASLSDAPSKLPSRLHLPPFVPCCPGSAIAVGNGGPPSVDQTAALANGIFSRRIPSASHVGILCLASVPT